MVRNLYTDCLSCLHLSKARPANLQLCVLDYALIFAYYGVAISIQRALFACIGGTSYYDFRSESLLFNELFDVFEELQRRDLKGLWLSCRTCLLLQCHFILPT